MKKKVLGIAYLVTALIAAGALVFAFFSGSAYSSQAFVVDIVLALALGVLSLVISRRSRP